MAENQHTKAQTLLKFTQRITKELMDSVIQKSSWASCEFNTHRRRRRDADATPTRLNSTVESRRRRWCVLGIMVRC